MICEWGIDRPLRASIHHPPQTNKHTRTELAGHLHREGFPPELYATPYFLTLFAHNLELYLVHRLWVRCAFVSLLFVYARHMSPPRIDI